QAGTSSIDGAAIYKLKCTACHAFDRRLVGPSHREVLEKYKDNKAGMVNFILHPKKVRPDFPAMPDQGLKPKEAQAVVDFMFKEYGAQIK
ncbi:MAG: cytochrome c, partial [Bacteroidota bacterium]|nr:cytochrome c [Bacteroidota bacterium]